MSVDQVKATLSDFYGEIANASVKETKRGDDTIYEFWCCHCLQEAVCGVHIDHPPL